MAYAIVDVFNRIVDATMDNDVEGYNVYFDNPDYVDMHARDGLNDFVIRSGKAVWEPTPERAAMFAQWDAEAEYGEILNLIVDSITIEDKPDDKDGVEAVKRYDPETNSIVWEFEE